MKLPLFFKPILWPYDFSKIDPGKDADLIIISAINYGYWEHWRWIFDYYGKNKIREIVKNTPQSEFRKESFRLIALLLSIKKTKYASRGDRIKAEKNIQ